MDQFRTEVKIDTSKEAINYHSRLFFMGSCFATNIGAFFNDHALNTLVNPFGVLYNPCSIANSLERVIKRKDFNEEEVFCQNGLFHSFYHHSQFSDVDQKVFLQNVNESLHNCYDFLSNTDVLVLTFGTAWVYEHKALGMIVSNCHKYPAKDFNRYRLEVDEIVERYLALIEAIRKINPGMRIIFTVSPVRHWKDGAHGNQLSKSTLLLAIDQLIKQAENCNYFPAYELLLDDLRDYRFFADDMLHPSQVAIEYIRDKFVETQFDSEAQQVLVQLAKLRKAAFHRPFNPETASHQSFVRKHISKVDAFQKQYPKIDLSIIRDSFGKQLV
jgi:hypothetical protein